MATASVSNVFAPNTTIFSSEANVNFQNLVDFLNNEVIHRDASKVFTALPSVATALDATGSNQFLRNGFIARGVHTDTGDGTGTHEGTIAFGKTFPAAPIVVGVVRSDTVVNIGLVWRAAPTTTGVPYRVWHNTSGNTISGTYRIYWFAMATQP